MVCFLALVMWWTLQLWMKASGPGTVTRKLQEDLRELKSPDLFQPTMAKNIRQRMLATLEKHINVLLQRMKIPILNRPKIIDNVVDKMA